MGGSVHFDKKAQRYFISVYWEGKRHRIFKHPVTGEPFHAKKSAEKILSRIRSEIDYGEFYPKSYYPDSPLSISEYAKEWLECINVKPATAKDYSNSVRNFITPYFENKDIRRIRYNDIVKFHKWIKRSDKGKYNVVSCLKTILRYAWRNEDITKVPPFPKLSYQLPEIEYLTFEQQNSVLEKIPARDRPIFYLMQEYGVRPGEASALCRDCVTDLEIIIKRSLHGFSLEETTKTGQPRRYAITDFMHSVLETMPKSINKYVFHRSDGKPYHNRTLNRIWREACSKVGVKIKMYNAFRHSLGCQLLDQGEDLDLVREQLGHTKMEMTRRYAKRSNSKLSDALNKRRKVVDIKERKGGGEI